MSFSPTSEDLPIEMATVARSKRVTDPLDERVKDRIIGRDRLELAYGSSGSEHSSQNDDVSSSSHSLSCLLHCFVEHREEEHEEHDDENKPQLNENDSDLDSERVESVNKVIISTLRNQNVDRFRNILLDHVLKSVQIFRSLKPNKQILNRNVMLFLQNLGYNAAICKTKWESSGGLTGGNYEFLDVVLSNSGDRYYIDVNFSGEFEIARQTNQFQRLAQKLPIVFVGKSSDLKLIVKLMSDEMRMSMKNRGLLLPPWRKNRFMQNKWFGPYRRTMNYMPAKVSSEFSVAVNRRTAVVKCSSVGFNVVDGAPLVHVATHIR